MPKAPCAIVAQYDSHNEELKFPNSNTSKFSNTAYISLKSGFPQRFLIKRIQTAENSDAYSIIKALMEKGLLVIRHKELVGWLDRLQSKGQITEEESQDLLQLADQLKIFDSLKYE